MGHPKSWVSLGANGNVVVGDQVNEETEGTGDSSIGSQVPVFLVLLGPCDVSYSCFYLLQRPKQRDLISYVDALFSPGQFSPKRIASKKGRNEIKKFNNIY